MHSSYLPPIHHHSQFNPDGYFVFCSVGKLYAAPYSRIFNPSTGYWHYVRLDKKKESPQLS
ncbi:hypothetical protein AR454_01865 [Bacillus mycoides]|uniref:hypothetical protein n=1 Tax=Bacillus mycoides TaxID=1405 RepID=UPI001E51E3B8|nr:hypothetical protein [Bacillus mycoides]MCD4647431.1 hypothetical protein [Bacillus mycoides]